MTTPTIDDTRIAEAAFHLWLDEGRPEGRAEDHWHRARTALEAEIAPVKKARKAAVTTAAKPAAKPRAKKTVN